MSHRNCNIHVATSSLPIQKLLARHTSACNSYSSRGSRGLARHTVMWNSLGSTWKSRSDSGEHWKGAPPFLSCQCFPNIGIALKWEYEKVTSKFQCQDMYMQHYTHSNTKNPKYPKTHHTPGHNPNMEKKIKCYSKKHQLENWTTIIKKYSRTLLGVFYIMIEQ